MTGRGGIGPILIVVVAVIAVVAMLTPRQGPGGLYRSPIGLAGLESWLEAQDLPVRGRFSNYSIHVDSVSLLILPLHDTNLADRAPRPETTEDLVFAETEYDQLALPILLRMRQVPSMIVLPKWRQGMRRTGIAHPDLLVDPDHVAALLDTLQIRGADVAQDLAGVGRTPGPEGLSAQIYLTQSFAAPNCVPMLGPPEAMVLGRCTISDRDKKDDDTVSEVLVVADPDLINNHGLRLGDNARLVEQILRAEIGPTAPTSEEALPPSIWIDYASRAGLVTNRFQGVQRERTWADLQRYFGMPFSALWVGAALCFALFFWRGAWRATPIQSDAPDAAGRRGLALRARARLMRSTGRDGALVADYTRARIATCVTTLFGPHRPRGDGDRAALLGFTERNRPETLAPLKAVLAHIDALPDQIAVGTAAHLIQDLDRLLEQITHDA